MTEHEIKANEFLLQDRLQKIRQIIRKYGEENFYISFSGGKDSTVLSALIDMALPENKIPRVYANTGIEYRLILEFVEREREKPHNWDLIILKPELPIKPTLEAVGYPFKSKRHAKVLDEYQRLGRCKTVVQYLGESKDKEAYHLSTLSCPQILKYQFNESFSLRISDKCCKRMKEEPLDKWGKENSKPFRIIGIMRAEGGRRSRAECLSFEGNKFKAFQPLAPLTKAWEEWFIEDYNVEISDIYKPPYSLERTGCKGCPFALHLQNELDTLERFFPAERKQCEIIWKPVYDEYRRLGYRLRKEGEGRQTTIEEFITK